MRRGKLFLILTSIILVARLEGQESAAKAATDSGLVRFSPGSALQIKAVSSALNYVGVPYREGGLDSSGLDCSGLVYLVFADLYPAQVPRTVEELAQSGDPVTGPLTAGDLVLFDTTGEGASHVGIYTGEGYFVHAASEGRTTGVILSALTEPYYKSRYLGARRLLEWSMPRFEVQLGSGKLGYAHGRALGPVPLEFQFTSPAREDLVLRLEHNGSFYLSRRLVLPANLPAGFWFWPQQGEYRLFAEDESGLSRLEIRFTVN